MKINDYIKKGSLVTLSATLLFASSPIVNANLGEEYNLNNSVQVYDSAEMAIKRVKSFNTLPKGKYFIYDKLDNAINITKNRELPGKWINLKDNLDVNNEYVEDVKSEEYNLMVSVKGFVNAEDAKNQENDVTIVKPGKYYIYYVYDGMINVTKIKNVPGAWINPNKNVYPKNINDNVIDQEYEYKLIESVQGYYTSENAIKHHDSVTLVEKGDYYIYTRANGMINITKNKDYAGVWINPNDLNKSESSISNIKNEEIKKEYFIQNPDSSTVNFEVESEKKDLVIKKEYKETLEKDEEDRVITNFVVDIDESINSNNKENIVSEIDKELINTKNETVKEVEIKNEPEKILETIFEKSEENSLDETNNESINEVQDDVESDKIVEIRNDNESIAESYIEDSTDKIDIETSENNLSNPIYNIGDVYELISPTDGYLRFTDAVESRNQVTSLSSGTYFINKVESGYINISKIKNEPGLWIKLN